MGIKQMAFSVLRYSGTRILTFETNERHSLCKAIRFMPHRWHGLTAIGY